ncbi:hypothetical protein [Solidesulfovibrio alcoholivorans]|uniref:hypothetical protein n=1 Tax=Solidesulfovibrio alcoholivorans TaxID=81406 RepID=UPI0006931CD0|nr:hypothetical protein [Solidesulfovibrio alcoholivorans]
MRLRRSPLPLLSWLAAGLLLLGAAPAAAMHLDPKPERAPVRLPDGLFAAQGDVEGLLRVKLFTKKVKYSRVLETAPLAWAQKTSPDGSLALSTAQGREAIAFGHFNEVALDVRDANPGNPTLAALTVRAPDGRTFASDPLECVDRLGAAYLESVAGKDASVPVARAEWADKTPLYLLRRLLDLPHDAVWRTAEDGPSTFLQRRFDRDLLDIGAVDLILRRPAPVQVNLVAALDPAQPRQRTVLDWYALAKRSFELPDGRTVLRVYVGRYLRARYPGLKAAKLKEISLMFFRQGEAEVRRDRVVERLVFVPTGLDPAWIAAHGLPGRLPTRVREPFPGLRRVFVNIAPAAAALGSAPDATATTALRLTPMAPGLSGGGALESAALVLVSPRRDTPAFLAAADELATGLGAAPDIDRADGGVTVQALWSLASPFEAVSGRSRVGQVRDATPVFLSGGEGLFKAQGGVRLYREPRGLVIEGRARELAIPVDAAFAPAHDAAYFFRLDIGACPGLAGVNLDVFAPGSGAPQTYALRPGAPTPLPDLPARVARAELRFTFTGREFSLPLSRAVLAAVPAVAPHEGLYEAKLPWPVATAGILEQTGEGRYAATPLTPFGRFSWLTAAYGLIGNPVAISVDGGAPAVPDTRSGIVAGRLPDGDGAATLAVSGLGGRAASMLELADPGFSGQAAAGWKDFFAAAPLAALDGRPYRPGPVSGEEARRLHEADDWFSLGQASLAPKAASARFFAHPWYGVSALCFETDRPVDLARFAAAPRSGSGGGPGTLSRAVVALVALLALGLGLRLAGRERLTALARRPAVWLAAFPGKGPRARRQFAWGLGACLCLAAAGLLLGAVPGRVVLGLAAACLVPVWRVVAPLAAARVAGKLPALGGWFCGEPGRLYFGGFALSLILAAVLREAMLARASEFLVQAGLYCFLAGLYLQAVPGRDASQAASRADTRP